MKKLLIIIVLLPLLTLTNAARAQENSINTDDIENISKYLSTITTPEPIKRVNPKYPLSAARNGREGWAILSFVINEEGRVEDIIVKDSSGSQDFIKESKKAAKKWRYKPAFSNGKAIQQCVNTVQLDFRMSGGGTKGVSRKFKGKYTKAVDALEAKDFKELDKLLAKMQKNRSMHLSEYNYLQLLSADYAKVQGDKDKQLKYLSRVAKALGRLSDEKQKLSVLYQVFNLEIELNEFKAAYATYERLKKLPVAEPYLAQFAETIDKVDMLIAGDKNLVIAGDIKEDFWTTALVRKEFSLTEIKGSLHTLDVRCANKRHQYTIEKHSTWKLPTSWENCSIYVYGEPNTSFKLVEHPLSI
ncbi:energy transducer TonB [Colwellia piezophila]|uniref:energy transducer TonB n=1 Tax=Colwellia piezophila TaxID=211668 RepID=UPI00037CB888|nr:energy transducer TonB [Colwellia piezophila]